LSWQPPDEPAGDPEPPSSPGGDPAWGGAPPPPPPPPSGWGSAEGGYTAQQPYGHEGYGAPAVPNYLVWSILSTLFCCVPAGIVSIVFAAQVNSKLASGDYAGAQQSSKNARTWAIVAVVAGLLSVVPLILISVTSSS
jgi:hypothetical protein